MPHAVRGRTMDVNGFPPRAVESGNHRPIPKHCLDETLTSARRFFFPNKTLILVDPLPGGLKNPQWPPQS